MGARCRYCHKPVEPAESLCRQGLVFCDHDCYNEWKDKYGREDERNDVDALEDRE